MLQGFVIDTVITLQIKVVDVLTHENNKVARTNDDRLGVDIS